MNIRIAQILEGGIDLETMQELPRSMLLVYGDRRATMPISDEQLKALMRLIGAASDEAMPATQRGPGMQVASHVQHPVNGNGVVDEDDDELPPAGDDYNDPETGVSAF